jgi:hypothetical protein
MSCISINILPGDSDGSQIILTLKISIIVPVGRDIKVEVED